jgi:hypothetical protein
MLPTPITADYSKLSSHFKQRRETQTTLECVCVYENQTFIFMRPFHRLCKMNTRQGNASAPPTPFAPSLQSYPNEIWCKDPHKTAWQILFGVDRSIIARTSLQVPQTDTHQNLRNGLTQCFPTAGPWHQLYWAARGKYFIVEIFWGE